MQFATFPITNKAEIKAEIKITLSLLAWYFILRRKLGIHIIFNLIGVKIFFKTVIGIFFF